MPNRGKAPLLPLLPEEDLQNQKLVSMKALSSPIGTRKEQHILGMRSKLVLPALAATLVIGLVMLLTSALTQPQ